MYDFGAKRRTTDLETFGQLFRRGRETRTELAWEKLSANLGFAA